MSKNDSILDKVIETSYQAGWETLIETDTFPPGLDEQVIRALSRKKKEPAFLLNWRLKAFDAWMAAKEPHWGAMHYNPIDYQSISYFSAPKSLENAPKSLDEVDPKL